jgi:hypothetical protein
MAGPIGLGKVGENNLAPSFRDGPKDQTRNLEIPGSRFPRPGMTVPTIPLLAMTQWMVYE